MAASLGDRLGRGDGRASQPLALATKRVVVRTGRLACTVVVAGAHYATPALARAVLADYPELARHACVNDRGPVFGAVIERASLPHLLEHLAISEQVRASRNPRATFVGTTEWTDEERGEALVQLSFEDDLDALRAYQRASAYLNGLLARTSV